jgi:hypothetical protein
LITLVSIDPPGYRGPVYLDLLPNLRRMELNFDSDIGPMPSLTTLGIILHHLSRSTLEELIIHTEWAFFNPEDEATFFSDNLGYIDPPPLLDVDAAITGPNFPSLNFFLLDLLAKYLWRPGQRIPKPQISKINMKIKNNLPHTSNSSNIQLNLTVYAKIIKD